MPEEFSKSINGSIAVSAGFLEKKMPMEVLGRVSKDFFVRFSEIEEITHAISKTIPEESLRISEEISGGILG